MERVDGEGDEAGPWWALAALLVAVVACLMALLPAGVALHALAPPPALVAPYAGALGAAMLMFKSLAIVWGLAARAWSAHKASVAVAFVD
jgi:hypothetical protein